jgi:uncharacterized protein YggE
MERTRFTTSTALAIAALALAAIAIASPAFASQGRGGGSTVALAAPDAAQVRSITVNGTGRVTLTPDMATVDLGVDTRAATAAGAQEAAATKMTAVLASVRSFGIADKDIATVNIGLSPTYDYNNGNQKLTGYEATQTLEVKVHKLSDTGKLIDSAVTAGASIISGINLTVSDPAAATAQARTAAVADAKARATALAQAAGVSLGAPISITEVTSPVTTPIPFAMGAAPAADKASTPIVPGTTEIDLDVQIVFAIG